MVKIYDWVCVGGSGHTVFASYSAAVFVCGGSGISFALSAVQELVQKNMEGKSRVKIIELIWSVQDPGKSSQLIYRTDKADAHIE